MYNSGVIIAATIVIVVAVVVIVVAVVVESLVRLAKVRLVYFGVRKHNVNGNTVYLLVNKDAEYLKLVSSILDPSKTSKARQKENQVEETGEIIWFSPKCVEAQQLTGHLGVKHYFSAGRKAEEMSGGKLRIGKKQRDEK
ncbi:hypothetical protein Tco_0099833 [Tanacetum coccineum]